MRKEWQEGNEDNIKSTGTALVAEGPFLMGLVHQGHQHSVFVLDISLFLFHLALEDQVTQVSFLCEPDKEFFEGGFYWLFPFFTSHEKTWDMAGSGDAFDATQEVCLGGVVVAVVAMAQFLNLVPVSRTQILTNDLLGDVPADVLAVITGLLGLDLLLLGFKNLGAGLFLGCIGEQQWTLTIGRGSHELTQNGVVAFLARQPVDGLEELFVGLFEIELLISHWDIISPPQLDLLSHSSF